MALLAGCVSPILLQAFVVAAPTHVQPEFDFYLIMDRCKATIAYLVPSDDSLKVFDGTPIHMACNRSSQVITCILMASDESATVKGPQATYKVVVDSPPVLQFADDRFADFVQVDTVTHTAVVITRVLDKRPAGSLAGSKVCWGIFTTEFERKAIGGDK